MATNRAGMLSHKKISNTLKLIISLLICCNQTYGFTELQATLEEACVGEDVTFSCTTSTYYIRWQITLSNTYSQPVVRFFQRSDSIGRSYQISTTELQLNFELISNSMGVLNSTLLVHTTAALDHALIECETTTTKGYRFQIARTPIQPKNITVSRKMYNNTAATFTLSWNLPTTGRVDMYHVNVSFEVKQTQLITTTPSVEVEGIPYDQLINISITSVNCHSESEKAYYNLMIERCNKTVPQEGLLVNDSSLGSLVIPREEIVFTCNPSFAPQVLMTAICQENGMWNPDLNAILCFKLIHVDPECQLPLFNNHLEIVKESFNSTTLGSELHFKCQSGFVSENVIRPAVCSSNGVWVPDPQEYECHQNLTELDVVQRNGNCRECSNKDHTQLKIIFGSVVGVVSVGSALFFVIIWRNKYGRIKTSISEEVNLGGTEPVYDTIDPTYEVILPVTERETKLTFNDAYNL